MSIWLEGHWPADVNHFFSEEEFENVQSNLNATREPILDAIEGSIEEANGNGDEVPRLLREKMAQIPRCPITTTDAYKIALQSIEDIGNYDFDNNTFTLGEKGWLGYEGNIEGVENHTLYHTARPYECGPKCPSKITYALET